MFQPNFRQPAIAAIARFPAWGNYMGSFEKTPSDQLPPATSTEDAPVRPNSSIAGVFGLLKRENQKSLTIEEIGEATIRGWSGDL
jgi:hypothetical protein